MRLSPILLFIAIAGGSIASSGQGQQPDNQLDPRSVALLRQGEAALAAGRLIEADDALEAALVVDPRNRAAFIALAKVAQRQKLFGQAIRFYNKALILEPTDRDAIAGQGQAMVELGAVARAQANLERLRALCNGPCPQAAVLAAAIARGPTVVVAKAPTSAPKKN